MMLHRGLDDCWSWPYKDDWNLLGWIFFRWYRHIKRQVDFEFEYQQCRRESSSERVDMVTDALHSFRLSITNELQFFHMLWGLSHIFGHRFISSLLFDPRQLHQVISVSIARHFSSCFFKNKTKSLQVRREKFVHYIILYYRTWKCVDFKSREIFCCFLSMKEEKNLTGKKDDTGCSGDCMCNI
jgi:hypothetical protein